MFFRCGRLFIRRIVQWKRLTGLCSSRVTRSNSSLLTFYYASFKLFLWAETDMFWIQSAVTSLCFTPDSEKIITASKDGTIRVWNINGMFYIYQPLCLLIFNMLILFTGSCHKVMSASFVFLYISNIFSSFLRLLGLHQEDNAWKPFYFLPFFTKVDKPFITENVNQSVLKQSV